MEERFRNLARTLASEQSVAKSVHKAVSSGECTFCGAHVRPEQSICDECGMPLGGIVCPVCGALSLHSFCVKCNTPLNRAAHAALERAKKDPVFQKVCALVEKAGKLKEKMNDLQQSSTEGTSEFLKMFTKEVSFTQPSDNDLELEYQQTVSDINRLFSEMLPPAGSTPQQQMNYYSARNVAVTTMVQDEIRIKAPAGWICNFCSCRHNQPSECVKPFLGGTWVYEDKVVQERVFKKEIISEE